VPGTVRTHLVSHSSAIGSLKSQGLDVHECGNIVIHVIHAKYGAARSEMVQQSATIVFPT
jgi:hypothetical protein